MPDLCQPDARQPDTRLRVLILGGTTESALLARRLVQALGDRLDLTTSLAGRTKSPGPLPGSVRIGGFGGVDGLAAHLREQQIALLIDASHPFAAQISQNARAAAALCGTPRLQVVRPPWPRDPLDRWIEVADLAGAAQIIRRVAKRIWLTVGASDLDAFAGIDDVHFLVRMIDPPRQPLPFAQAELVLARGPFALAEELALIRHHKIGGLVAKASGGVATEAKIIAARYCDLPVVMVRRPPPEPGETVDCLDAAVDWVLSRAP
jgi:precorrin-6A/cobalt-precorrin-6A reductase